MTCWVAIWTQFGIPRDDTSLIMAIAVAKKMENMKRFQRLRSYAQKLSDSISKFFRAIGESISNIWYFFVNVVSILFTTIRRGIRILWRDFVDVTKSILRLVFDIARWPLEHIIVPVTRWLKTSSELLLEQIQNRDDIALISFVVLVLLCCGCACLLFLWGLGFSRSL